jgi:hypothetical protein
MKWKDYCTAAAILGAIVLLGLAVKATLDRSIARYIPDTDLERIPDPRPPTQDEPTIIIDFTNKIENRVITASFSSWMTVTEHKHGCVPCGYIYWSKVRENLFCHECFSKGKHNPMVYLGEQERCISGDCPEAREEVWE